MSIATEQVAAAQSVLGELTLRRLRAEVGGPSIPIREILLPLELTCEQMEAYRAILARGFDVLADPAPPRQSGLRAAQMRSLCAEIRKVCLFMLPALGPSGLQVVLSMKGAGDQHWHPWGCCMAQKVGHEWSARATHMQC